MKLLTCEYQGRAGGSLPDGSLLKGEALPLESVRLLAPIPEPAQDVVCLGMNYAEHSAEAERWGGEAEFKKNAGKAVYFSKRASYIIGPGDYIDGHFDIVDSLDYEAELAVVLGRDAYRVSEAEAEDYVLGYSVLNDKQFYFGKSLDTHTAMGPWIVTRDEFEWEPQRGIRCFINGEKRQDSNTRFEIYGAAHVIAELSAGMTLKAGTIIAMGTPAGVGMGFTPPKYLKSGDVVRCEIDGIGVLENTVR